MGRSTRAGVIAIAAVALGVGLSGCGSDTKTAETTSAESSSETNTTTEASPTPGQPAGNKTIVDYIRENEIVETPVKKGDPGSPAINLPLPPGWSDASAAAPQWAYAAMASADPAMGGQPPTIIALLSKLTGNVEPAKILEFAPGELKNLPGFEGPESGQPTKLGGFDAVQIGGTYTKEGVKRAIAQKTVVIPGQDGLFVLQLNADGREDQMMALMDATSVIDEQTTITP
jgi:Probable lipoprotein LpqN